MRRDTITDSLRTIAAAINTLHLYPGTSRHSPRFSRAVLFLLLSRRGSVRSEPYISIHGAPVAAMAGHGDLQEMLRMLTARKASMMAAMGYIKALQAKNLKRRDTSSVDPAY